MKKRYGFLFVFILSVVSACARVTYIGDDDGSVIVIAGTGTTTGEGGSPGTGGSASSLNGTGGSAPCDTPLKITVNTDVEWAERLVESGSQGLVGAYLVENECEMNREIHWLSVELLDTTKPADIESLVIRTPDETMTLSEPTSVAPNGTTMLVPLPGTLIIPAHQSIGFNIDATFAAVHPLSEVGSDLARSGDWIKVGLTNVTDTDDVSATIDPSIMVPFIVLHKSTPLVMIDSETNDPLTDGMNTVFRMVVKSSPGDHQIGLRQIGLKLDTTTDLTINDDTLNPFLVNGVEIPKGAFAGVYENPPFGATAILAFPDSDVVASPGNDLTIELRVNVSGVNATSHIVTYFDPMYEDYVANMQLQGTSPPGYLTMMLPPPNNLLPVSSGFIWTDFSEGPDHVESSPSSFDYLSIFLVTGASTVVLASPNL